MFDITKCKRGDALETRGGEVVYYAGGCRCAMYPHEIRYSNGVWGTRTNNGRTVGDSEQDRTDVIGFHQTPWRPLSLIKPADGQSVFLRIEKPDGPRYKCATAPIRRRSTDGVFWMEVPK